MSNHVEFKKDDKVTFYYRDNLTEATVIKVTPTRIQLKFKPKTWYIDERTIWKQKTDTSIRLLEK